MTATRIHQERFFITVHTNNDGSRSWTWEIWHAIKINSLIDGDRYRVGAFVARGHTRIRFLAWVQARLHADRIPRP